MLLRAKTLEGFTLHATDGDIGSVARLFFDDAHWTARYVVVDTGNWLSGREVLISPTAILATDAEGRRLHTDLSREQVEKSPDVDTDKPVSRQKEIDFAGYYGWPYWWIGPGLTGPILYPGTVPPAPEIVE